MIASKTNWQIKNWIWKEEEQVKNSGQRILIFTRKTKETNIDGTGMSLISKGIKFLDHKIDLVYTPSLIDIEILANEDLKHHIVEDVALGLREALSKALALATQEAPILDERRSTATPDWKGSM
jgi:imidazoleglycerol phosphate dehydratase HisB